MIVYPIPDRVRVTPSDGAPFEATVMGLVATGVWVHSSQTLPFRASATITFLSGSGPELALRAEVVSAVGGGVGFEVVSDTPPEALAVLASWAAGSPARAAELVELKAARLGAGQHARVKTPFRPLAGVTVLVVEDEPAVARLLELALSSRGATVIIAGDGIEALALMSPKLDAVLLDWMLPLVSGEAVLRAIHEKSPQIPVAIVSGVTRIADNKSAAQALGAETVFSKPFKVALICEWVERVTGAVP